MFTQKCPPKSGQVKKLWDWFTKQAGKPPDAIYINRPGPYQLAAGVARYHIASGGNSYLVFDVDSTLAMSISEADFDKRTGDYYLL